MEIRRTRGLDLRERTYARGWLDRLRRELGDEVDMPDLKTEDSPYTRGWRDASSWLGGRIEAMLPLDFLATLQNIVAEK